MWLKRRISSVVHIRIIEINEKDYYLEDYNRIAEEFKKEGTHYSPTMLDGAVYRPKICGRFLRVREDDDDGDKIEIDLLYLTEQKKSKEEIKRIKKVLLEGVSLKKQVFDNMKTRVSDDDTLLDKLEEFARKNKECHGALELYERAIVGVCGGLFRADNVYYDEVVHQRKRYERFKAEYPSYHTHNCEESERCTAIINGLAFSHIIQKRDGSIRTPQEAQKIYQYIFDELRKDTGGFHDGYLNILYGIARDSIVYQNKDAAPLYQNFEDQVFDILHEKCATLGEPEFGRKYIIHLAATIRGCYFDPLVKNMIDTPNELLLRILTAMVHFTDRIYDNFAVALTYEDIDPTRLSHDIRKFMMQYLRDNMDSDDLFECEISYRKKCVGKFDYDPRGKGEKYTRKYPKE